MIIKVYALLLDEKMNQAIAAAAPISRAKAGKPGSFSSYIPNPFVSPISCFIEMIISPLSILGTLADHINHFVMCN